MGERELREYGVSEFRASSLARSGWLTHLGRGVYMLPGETLSRDGCLGFLTHRLPGFHVGGRTALDCHGIRQNVSFREVLTLWGRRVQAVALVVHAALFQPVSATQLFDARLPKGAGLRSLPVGRPDVLVSVPERALIELLSDVGKIQPLEEERQLVGLLYTLREKVLDQSPTLRERRRSRLRRRRRQQCRLSALLSSLEELHCPLVLLSSCACIECAEIAPLVGSWVGLAGIQSVFTGLELTDHADPHRNSCTGTRGIPEPHKHRRDKRRSQGCSGVRGPSEEPSS